MSFIGKGRSERTDLSAAIMRERHGAAVLTECPTCLAMVAADRLEAHQDWHASQPGIRTGGATRPGYTPPVPA